MAKRRVTKIADEHHVVRHCKNRLLLRRRSDDKAYGVQPDHFHLRSATADKPQEKYLSATYYEFFSSNAKNRMKACAAAITKTLKPKDGLVRLSVGQVKEQGAKRSIKLRVTHEPSRHSASYSTIRGVPFKPDEELCALLAHLAIVEIVEVKNL
jgi:hypothetical protein